MTPNAVTPSGFADLAEAVPLAELVDRSEGVSHVSPFSEQVVRCSSQAVVEVDARLVAEERFAASTSAHDARTSASRAGSYAFSTGFPSSSPIASASALTVTEPPVATLMISPPTSGASAARRFAADDVVDEREVARLLSVAVDRDRLAVGDRA